MELHTPQLIRNLIKSEDNVINPGLVTLPVGGIQIFATSNFLVTAGDRLLVQFEVKCRKLIANGWTRIELRRGGGIGAIIYRKGRSWFANPLTEIKPLHVFGRDWAFQVTELCEVIHEGLCQIEAYGAVENNTATIQAGDAAMSVSLLR